MANQKTTGLVLQTRRMIWTWEAKRRRRVRAVWRWIKGVREGERKGRGEVRCRFFVVGVGFHDFGRGTKGTVADKTACRLRA